MARPQDSPALRRRAAGVAGHVGDEAAAREALAATAGVVRAAGFSALVRMGGLRPADLEAAFTDTDPAVRRRACELAASLWRAGPCGTTASVASGSARGATMAAALAGPADALPRLIYLLADPAPSVVEAACFALGELAACGRDAAQAPAGTPEPTRLLSALSAVARSHPGPLCREAAVAALGSVGDPAGLAAVLQGLKDKPAVRRRAVLALAAFEGEEVDEALARALGDPDWQVRQAAEDMLGRGG